MPFAVDRPFSAPLAKYVSETYTELSSVLDKLASTTDQQERGTLEAKKTQLMQSRDRIQELIVLREHFGGLAWTWAADKINMPAFPNLIAGRELPAFVMSIDIRRSTQLMLNATDPPAFANFILALCEKLRKVIWDHHGIFEKFTGDGILACFPNEYTAGTNTAKFVLQAASECQRVFNESYAEFRDHFQVVTKDTGIGIGVDYGTVYLARQLAGLTVVGRAVVYACRLSASNAILFNHQAYRELRTYARRRSPARSGTRDKE